jgi:hypothetical protein
MVKVTHTWREKRLAREEGNEDSSDNRQEEDGEIATGCQDKSTCQRAANTMAINMLFTILGEF